MSSARTVRSPFPSTRLTLVGAIADLHRCGEAQGQAAWRDPVQVGRDLALSRGATLAQVNRAEALGLIDRKEIESGERIALTDLGWKLFGLDDRNARRPARAALAEVPGRDPLVQLLIHWPVAVALVEELADYLQRDVEAFWDEVLLVEQSGAVETWPDHPAGPAVILSAATAERLDLALSVDGSRWLRPHQTDRTSIEQSWQLPDHYSGISGEAILGGEPDGVRILEQFPDPNALEGLEAVALAEAGDREIHDLIEQWTDPSGARLLVLDRQPTIDEIWQGEEVRRFIVLPPPLILLGERLLWPVGRSEGEPCPSCHDARLGVRTYCLVCSRSGLDDVIREILGLEGKPRRIRHHRPAAKGVPVRKGRTSSSTVVVGQALRGGIG